MSDNSSQPMMELIARAAVEDESTLEDIATVVVGVCADEGQQFTPLRVILDVDNYDIWSQRYDLAKRKEDTSRLLFNIALRIEERFFESGRAEDLEIIIALHRKALGITPKTHSAYPPRITNLAKAIEARYNHSGHSADLDLVVNLHHASIAALWQPPRALSPTEEPYLSNLTDALGKRYNNSRDPEDLDNAILFRRQIVNLIPPPGVDHIDALRLLAQPLGVRFHHRNQAVDLDEAIDLWRTAFMLGSSNEEIDDAARTRYLRELAKAIYSRFRSSNRRDDMEELINLNRRILENGLETDSDRETTLSLLGLLLHERFGRSGNPDDLDSAISIQLQLFDIQKPPHPQRYKTIINLSSLLHSKFELEGNRKSLDEAVARLYEALYLVPAPHEDRPKVLTSLSIILRERFEETNQYDDLLDAIDLAREALKLKTTSKQDRMFTLNSLAGSLWSQYEPSTGTEDDLDIIISLYQEALDQLSKDHRTYTAMVGNLANVLSLQFDKSHDPEDLRQAILLFQESLSTTDLLTNRGIVLINLGLTFCRIYWLGKDSAFLDQAMTAFRSVAANPNSYVSQRSVASRTWAEHADHYKHSSAMEAYRLAIELLPSVIPINADLELRQHKLTSNITPIDGLAAAAAVCALGAGKFEDAIEFLEAGRAVFWSQAMKLRLPVGDLEIVNPELAENVRDIRRQLEAASFSDHKLKGTVSGDRGIASDHQASVHSRQLHLKWNTMLKDIHQLPGFEHFFQPHRFSALQKCAIEGPVVMVCMTKTSSHALIMTSSHVKHLPLHDINLQEVSHLVKAMECVRSPGSRGVSSDSAISEMEEVLREMSKLEILGIDRTKKVSLGKRPPSTDDVLRSVLKVLWLKIMEPVVRFLELKKSPDPSRIYWCPTGPLTFLPIHAAGLYEDSSSPMESIADYVVSSYLPTIGTLLNSRVRHPQDMSANKILAIVQPKTLPAALDELQKIEKHFEPELPGTLIKLGDKPSNPATVKAVLSHLSSSSIVHFACHGEQHIGKPLESALTLEDGKLSLSMIMQEDMKNAQLAFLSACETATGEQEAPDESLHLGAALLFAGFKGVVATMWAIADIDGPKIADEFYKKLLQGKEDVPKGQSGMDTNQAARALDHAVLELRAAGVPLQRWVPFIYLGV